MKADNNKEKLKIKFRHQLFARTFKLDYVFPVVSFQASICHGDDRCAVQRLPQKQQSTCGFFRKICVQFPMTIGNLIKLSKKISEHFLKSGKLIKLSKIFGVSGNSRFVLVLATMPLSGAEPAARSHFERPFRSTVKVPLKSRIFHCMHLFSSVRYFFKIFFWLCHSRKVERRTVVAMAKEK